MNVDVDSRDTCEEITLIRRRTGTRARSSSLHHPRLIVTLIYLMLKKSFYQKHFAQVLWCRNCFGIALALRSVCQLRAFRNDCDSYYLLTFSGTTTKALCREVGTVRPRSCAVCSAACRFRCLQFPLHWDLTLPSRTMWAYCAQTRNQTDGRPWLELLDAWEWRGFEEWKDLRFPLPSCVHGGNPNARPANRRERWNATPFFVSVHYAVWSRESLIASRQLAKCSPALAERTRRVWLNFCKETNAVRVSSILCPVHQCLHLTFKRYSIFAVSTWVCFLKIGVLHDSLFLVQRSWPRSRNQMLLAFATC